MWRKLVILFPDNTLSWLTDNISSQKVKPPWVDSLTLFHRKIVKPPCVYTCIMIVRKWSQDNHTQKPHNTVLPPLQSFPRRLQALIGRNVPQVNRNHCPPHAYPDNPSPCTWCAHYVRQVWNEKGTLATQEESFYSPFLRAQWTVQYLGILLRDVIASIDCRHLGSCCLEVGHTWDMYRTAGNFRGRKLLWIGGK